MSHPQNRVRVDTSSTMICVYIVYMYVSSRVAAVCTYVHITWQHLSSPHHPRPKKGDPNGPLFSRIPAGIFILRLGQGLRFVHIVHSTWRHSFRSFLRQRRGPEWSPILTSPAGLFTTPTWQETRAHHQLIFGPRVHFCIYFLPPVASYSNPKSLNLVVSCIPVLYYVYLHMFYAF